MSSSPYRPIAAAALVCLAVATGPVLRGHAAQSTPPPGSAGDQAKPANDLDAFMEQVLARREVNRKVLNQYILDETEAFEILGPGKWPLYRQKHDFTWYARDGMHVRSPVKFNGVPVDETARQEYETRWIKHEEERRERKARHEREKKEISIGTQGVQIGGEAAVEPRFVSEAYFMDFKFEKGNYYLAGREKLEGQEVLRIEYYPTHLFNDDDDEKTPHEIKKPAKDESRADRRERQEDEKINRKMNKTALVTLWVDPKEHQIVKYTFDNVWLDFLPGAWLVRIDDLRASMTMGQPFPGVWLPRGMNIHAGLTMAMGSIEASYERAFREYREADIKTKIKIPKIGSIGSSGSGFTVQEVQRVQRVQGVQGVQDVHGPFVGDEEQPGETIREVRVHGNASLADADVLKLAGIAVGDPISDASLKAIEQRLKDSKRFETIEVRKRYRSLDDPTDVALVLVVHERPGVTTLATSGVSPVTRPWRRLTSRLMFFPIVNYDDGYGFTYGARLSTMDLLGAGERLSVPLTWGGTRRVAIEGERTFKRGPLTRVLSSFGIWQRENPRFEIDDRRVELKGRAERVFLKVFRTGLEASRSSVHFAPLEDQLWTLGANAMIDTRLDPAFPGNAVVLGGGWSELNVKGLDRINRYTADARGYLRVTGQSVLAGRVQYYNTDAALPPYERLLLGGSSTLRGFDTGTFDGDRMLITSGELRIPITSVISDAKLGMTIFYDAAKAVNFGASLKDAEWHRGAGAGIFLIAPLVRINLDVAHGFHGGTQLNIGTGFSF